MHEGTEPVAVTASPDGDLVWAEPDGGLWHNGDAWVGGGDWDVVSDLVATPDGTVWAATDAGLLRAPPPGEPERGRRRRRAAEPNGDA